VPIVWLVLHEQREVIVVTSEGERRCGAGERLPAHRELPDLGPTADEFFVQISISRPAAD